MPQQTREDPPSHLPLRAVWLGTMEYERAFALQQRLAEARRTGVIGDTVLFLEHPPVVTMGRGTHRENLLRSRDELAELGVSLAEVDRGGDVTLHAPGQLVCYPILDLTERGRDVRRYVRALTETMRRTVADLGISTGTVSKYVGLWTDASSPQNWPGEEAADDLRKIGAIGVRVSRWITLHGFALNLQTDLRYFLLIVPCGIAEHGVTSVQQLLGQAPSPRECWAGAAQHLAATLGDPPPTLEDLSDRVEAIEP